MNCTAHTKNYFKNISNENDFHLDWISSFQWALNTLQLQQSLIRVHSVDDDKWMNKWKLFSFRHTFVACNNNDVYSLLWKMSTIPTTNNCMFNLYFHQHFFNFTILSEIAMKLIPTVNRNLLLNLIIILWIYDCIYYWANTTINLCMF